MPRFVETLDEFNMALNDPEAKLMVVYFTASWCGPCKIISPYFKELSEDEDFSEVVFLKVDVNAAAEVAEHCGVSSMPTFQYFRMGVKVDELVGANRPSLLKKLRDLK